MISISELVVFVALWPALSYTVGSCLPFLARHWAKWLRPIPGPVLGAIANVVGAVLAILAVVLA